MSLGRVEVVRVSESLAAEVRVAIARLRSAGVSEGALHFEASWQPTMDLVDIVARELDDDPGELRELTLVHPSAAMTFIASAISLRVSDIAIRGQRSIHDDADAEAASDATASRNLFAMKSGERAEDFFRRAVAEVRSRQVSRFALAFDPSVTPSMELAAVLAEELLHSGVTEVGLIHPRAPLDTFAAALRLRLPNLQVALATKGKTHA